MIKLEFWLREPGNHHLIYEAEWPVVPRAGDQVEIQDSSQHADQTFTIQRVVWSTDDELSEDGPLTVKVWLDA